MTNTADTANLCGLRREDFQATIDGKATDLYILKNNEGNEVAITNYGGAIVAIMVPDKDGKHANVIQGHDNIKDVVESPEPYLSTLIGRYGNRICKGKFQLHGKEYSLPINNGPNCLHGGKKGFNAKVWDALQMNDHTLVLKYVSPYGEEGFSGEVRVTVVYAFNDDNELSIDYMATTNKNTVINLTSHGFFSLAGIADPTPTIDNLVCEINADYYLPIDETWRYLQPSLAFRSTQTTGLTVTRDSTVPPSHAEALSALRHNISPIRQIILISRLWFLSQVSNTHRRRFISLVLKNSNGSKLMMKTHNNI